MRVSVKLRQRKRVRVCARTGFRYGTKLGLGSGGETAATDLGMANAEFRPKKALKSKSK